MKTIILFAAMMAGTISKAQVTSAYWVVETKPHQNSSLVRFYNSNNLLLEELTIKNKTLSVSRSSHKRYLNRRLKEVEKRVVATAKR